MTAISRLSVAIFIGTLHLAGKSVGLDVGVLKVRALSGELNAQLRLGLHFSSDSNLKNYNEAFFWYEKAAKANDPLACHYLGKAHATGKGTAQNLELAANWYRKSAGQGNALAMIRLGELLSRNGSEKTSWPEAHAWFALAVEKGETACTTERDLLAKKLSEQNLEMATTKLKELKAKILAVNKHHLATPSSKKAYGEYKFPSGHSYFGAMKNGLPHGYGRLKTKEGELFYGEFRSGAPSGYGTLFSPEGFILFTGLWEKDKAVTGNSPQALLQFKLKNP